jgi:iron(III) transport system ATP-binding protein
MPVIQVSHLVKTFGTFNAVDDVSFSVDESEIVVIVGESGCGKTTTLRCIAGLETPTAGTISIDGRPVSGPGLFVPPEKRGVGMVFQSYALWPHKTVFENVAYTLVLRRLSKDEIRRSVEEMLSVVNLASLADRYPAMLSGGQQQRVALARSAVARPKVLLFDEPLSNLDAKLRQDMRDELKRLIKELKSTAIHITHDQEEAMAIADRVICMRNGRIEQVGTGRELYRSPANRFIADFIGRANFLDGQIESNDASGIVVRVGSGLSLRAAKSPSTKIGDTVSVPIRLEDVHLSSSPIDGFNTFQGRITAESFLGDHTEYTVDLGGISLKAKSATDLAIGSLVYIAIDPSRLVCLAA